MKTYGLVNLYYYPLKQDNPYKIVFHKERFRSPEDEKYFSNTVEDEEHKQEKLITVSEGEKLMNNIARVKTKVRDYAYCNEWDYFVTFTFSDENIDRYDLKEIKKRMGKFFNNYKNRKSPDFCYLLVPEFHKDGAVHFHGLVKGILDEDLHEFCGLGQTPYGLGYSLKLKSNKQFVMLLNKLPVYIQSHINSGNKVYDFYEFSKRFGFTTVEPIRNPDAAASYIIKYITKDLVALPLGTCCYLNSQGLKVPELLHQDFGGIIPLKINYENDFVAVKWISDKTEYLNVMMGI